MEFTQDGKGLAPALSSELSSPPLLACLQLPASPSSSPHCRAECPQPAPAGTHATWCLAHVWARMTPPGPAGIPSHPLPPPPPERSVPIPSPFSARDTGSRRGHSTDRYKHTDAPGDAHRRVPQRGTGTGIHAGLGTHTHTHAHTCTRAPKETLGQSPLAQIPAGRSRPAGLLPGSGKPIPGLCPWC